MFIDTKYCITNTKQMRLSDQPIFIVGCERSGTTILRLMLNEHSRIALPPQTKFSRKVYKRRLLFGNLVIKENRRKIIQWMLERKNNTKLVDLKLDDKVLEKIWNKCTTLGAIIASVFQQYALERNKPRWGDKRPYYIRYITQLFRLYPDAQIIHVVRDGHDCLASLKRMPWWKKNAIFSMLNWRHAVRIGSNAANVYKDQFMEIRYEDLIKEPESQLEQICEFLNESYEPEMINFHLNAQQNIPEYKKPWHYKTSKPLTATFIGQWRKELSKGETQILEWCAQKELMKWNYQIKKIHFINPIILVRYFIEYTRFYGLVGLERIIDRFIDLIYSHPISYKQNH